MITTGMLHAPSIQLAIRLRIKDIIRVFDAHDPGCISDQDWRCPCGWAGTAHTWPNHLADKLAALWDDEDT